MFELRAVKKTVQDLYDNIINPYDADVYICVQKALPDDLERLELFQEKVVYKELYDKPDPNVFFGPDQNLTLKNKSHNSNWNITSNLQIYINQHRMAQVIYDIVDKYDYYILLRSDAQILFPFPNKEFFENMTESMYFVDSQYCKAWGDNGWPTFIHRKYILQYLNSYVEIMKNPIYKEDINEIMNKDYGFECNQEKFQYACLGLCHLNDKIKYIKNLNYFMTAEKVDDYTTWSKPHIHRSRLDIVSKYDEQVDEAFANDELWQNGYTWKTNGECIYLAK
jgi:hypothetical protein